jgi:hypothetical protein
MEVAPASGLSPAGVDVSESTYFWAMAPSKSFPETPQAVQRHAEKEKKYTTYHVRRTYKTSTPTKPAREPRRIRGVSPSYDSEASRTPPRRQNPPQERRSPSQSPSRIYQPPPPMTPKRGPTTPQRPLGGSPAAARRKPSGQ